LSVAAIYKVSYVVVGEDHPGAILNTDREPRVGDRVEIGERSFTVVEVQELIPPHGDFHFLHASLKSGA
jgi:hypothetical protein